MEDDPLYADIAGAELMVRNTASQRLPDGPRHIHRMRLMAPSVYAPRPPRTPAAPARKTIDTFGDALPLRDRDTPAHG